MCLRKDFTRSQIYLQPLWVHGACVWMCVPVGTTKKMFALRQHTLGWAKTTSARSIPHTQKLIILVGLVGPCFFMAAQTFCFQANSPYLSFLLYVFFSGRPTASARHGRLARFDAAFSVPYRSLAKASACGISSQHLAEHLLPPRKP